MIENDLLIYSMDQNDTYQRLQRALNCLGMHQTVPDCQSVEALIEHLKQRSTLRPVIILISVLSQAELDEIAAIHTPALFRDAKIILVLPDHQPDMIRTGFSLQPRFMTFIDADFSEIAKVLAKMLGRDAPCPGNCACEEEI